MTMPYRTLACALLLAFVSRTDSEPLTLVGFPKAEIGINKWMKAHGWKAQRGNPEHFRIGEERLLMVSDDDSIAIGTEDGFPLDPHDTPIIRFQFRVLQMPTGTDLSKKNKDDAAFRLYVAFDRGGGFLRPPNTIAYSWTEKLNVGSIVESPHFSNLSYLSIGKGMPGNKEWVTVERNLLADYRAIFGTNADVPDLKGILLKCDSNNTETSARSEVALVELRTTKQPIDNKK